jgi:hypothetical protein
MIRKANARDLPAVIPGVIGANKLNILGDLLTETLSF